MGPDAIDHCGATQNPPQGACVLLRHDLPDGSWHYDLLMELRPGTPDEHRLAAVRLTPVQLSAARLAPAAPERPQSHGRLTIAPGIEIDPAAPCVRLPDHRAIYLTYEGPISGNRGHVRRVAQGYCLIDRIEAATFAATLTATLAARLNLGQGWLALQITAHPPHHHWQTPPTQTAPLPA